MKKWIALLLAAMLLVTVFAGCAKAPAAQQPETNTTEQTPAETPDTAETPEEPETAETPDEPETPEEPEEVPEEPEEPAYEAVDINVAVMKGPTGMGMSKLMDEAANGNAANNYAFTVSSDVSEVMAKVIAGDYDIAAMPTNNAAVAFNKTEGEVQMAAINTMGTLYLLQKMTDESAAVTSVEDLRGCTIVTFGQGANPEYVLTRILEQAGLVVGTDVNIEFKGSVDEVLGLAVAGEAEFVMVPEPNATVVQIKNDAYQVALDLNEVWTAQEGTLVMGCVVVTRAFAEAHPEAVVKFLEEYEASIKFVQENIKDAAALCAAYEIVPNEGIAMKSLPGCHLTFIAGADMQAAVEGYYEVLFGYNPKAVGGKIPTEEFYFVG